MNEMLTIDINRAVARLVALRPGDRFPTRELRRFPAVAAQLILGLRWLAVRPSDEVVVRIPQGGRVVPMPHLAAGRDGNDGATPPTAA